MNFAKWRHQLSTAPFLAGGNCIRDLPSIRMEKVQCYPYAEILQAAQRATTYRNFRTEFPDIIQNQCDNWVLWQVNIKVDQISLHYLNREDYASGARKLSNSNRRNVVVVVNSPITLGVRLIVPAAGRQPLIDCECVMCCSNPNGTHTITIAERQGDETSPTLFKLTRPPQ